MLDCVVTGADGAARAVGVAWTAFPERRRVAPPTAIAAGFDGSGINSKIDNSLRNTGNKNKNLIISKKVLYIKDLEYKQEKILSRKIKLFY